MEKRGRKKQKPLTEEELLQRRARYNHSRKMKRRVEAAKLKQERSEWNEFGHVVRKMNKEANLSQESIYELLGGLVSLKKIALWCKPDFRPR